MKNRTPVARAERAPIPDFAPVPRKTQRHDGWTPDRQRAFIEALADTGSVSRAAAMVNMTPRCAYYLRRQPGAEGFRRAWEAALDFGVARMKDIAFERAIEGTLVPVMVGGKLIGWRRIYNDRLLMFCLRHYGEDASGKRTTINYFSTRAVAGASLAPSAATPTPARPVGLDGRATQAGFAGASQRDASPGRPTTGGAVSIDEQPFQHAGVHVGHAAADSLRDGATSFAGAETSVTSVRTTMRDSTAPDLDQSTRLIEQFAGLDLDGEAQAAILAALADCAARRRAVAGTADDESEPFVAALQPEQDILVYDPGYKHPRKERGRPPPAYDVAADPIDMVEPSPLIALDPSEEYRAYDGEMPWTMLDQAEEMDAIDRAVAEVRKAKKITKEEKK